MAACCSRPCASGCQRARGRPDRHPQPRRAVNPVDWIWGSSLKANQISHAIYRDYLPDALAEGRYVAVPKPSVVGHGVEDFQQAMDIQLKDVSAAKIVVALP